MHHSLKTLLTVAIFFVTSSSIAQEPYHFTDPDLMARLSYENSGVLLAGAARHVCVAVSRDGEYRIVRSLDNGQAQRLHGKMPKEELAQLSNLLRAADFRSLSGEHAGLIRQKAEKFAAEIPLGDRLRVDGARKRLEHESWRLQWLNADGASPFPASVSRVVDWLQHFQPTDGKAFEYTEYPDVCPTGGLRYLQPSVAENSHP
jgi:hypothetical protein